MTAFALRDEQPGDEGWIHDLIARAFAPMAFSDSSEPDLVDALRREGDLALSLVAATPGGELIGHVGFSPVTIGLQPCRWFQMAPLSVDPDHQRQGVGSALIEAGLARLRAAGAHGVAVVGNPAYYERFGFDQIAGLGPAAEHDQPFFRAQVLTEPAPVGILRYARAFG